MIAALERRFCRPCQFEELGVKAVEDAQDPLGGELDSPWLACRRGKPGGVVRARTHSGGLADERVHPGYGSTRLRGIAHRRPSTRQIAAPLLSPARGGGRAAGLIVPLEGVEIGRAHVWTPVTL